MNLKRMRKVSFQSWGSAAPGNGYILLDIEGHESVSDVIARSIERRTGLQWCGGPRSDGRAVSAGETESYHFTGTLGRPCPGGGWTPEGECWFSYTPPDFLTEQAADEVLDTLGCRLLGRDPYHDYKWHVAKWNEDRSLSYSVGWAETLEDAIEMAGEHVCEMAEEGQS